LGRGRASRQATPTGRACRGLYFPEKNANIGERAKVVIFSVTEGEDKPFKYPHMFSAASVVILSKTDLLPHLRFDRRLAVANALSVNPRLEVFEVSAYSGEGLAAWYGWLKGELAACVGAARRPASRSVDGFQGFERASKTDRSIVS